MQGAQMIPTCAVQPLLVAILPELYTERLAATRPEDLGDLDDALAELHVLSQSDVIASHALAGLHADLFLPMYCLHAQVMELELIYHEFEEALLMFARYRLADEQCPWDPESRGEGQETAHERPGSSQTTRPGSSHTTRPGSSKSRPGSSKSRPGSSKSLKAGADGQENPSEFVSLPIQQESIEEFIVEELLGKIGSKMQKELQALASAA
ncbi:MAG: hypothetical protein SGPRY_013912 [Prymnesium sp.]